MMMQHRNHGQFQRRGHADPAPLLRAMMRAKSLAHVRGWQTRKTNLSAAVWAHVMAMGELNDDGNAVSQLS